MRDIANYSLKEHNTFGIEARCSRFLEYSTVEEAKVVAAILRETKEPYIKAKNLIIKSFLQIL